MTEAPLSKLYPVIGPKTAKNKKKEGKSMKQKMDILRLIESILMDRIRQNASLAPSLNDVGYVVIPYGNSIDERRKDFLKSTNTLINLHKGSSPKIYDSIPNRDIERVDGENEDTKVFSRGYTPVAALKHHAVKSSKLDDASKEFALAGVQDIEALAEALAILYPYHRGLTNLQSILLTRVGSEVRIRLCFRMNHIHNI
jgi:hypothetical protein